MRRRATQVDEKVADLTPMLDVVFIMLIFFIVTATFIKESGAEIDRPDTKTAEPKKVVSLLVGVDSNSNVWIDKKRVDIRNVRPMMERLHAENPKGSVVIQADKKSTNNMLVIVMDASRAAGVFNVSIAANP